MAEKVADAKEVTNLFSLSAHKDSDSLPNAAELDLIEQIRNAVPDELQRRKSIGLDYPCLFGDVALARVLRGCGGDVDQAQTWFKRCLENVAEYKIDDLIARMTKVLDEHPDEPCGSTHMLPNYSEVKDYVREIFHYSKCAGSGDLINYFAWSDINSQGILDNLDWDKFVQYHRGATILRMVVLERQSRLQGRMVKVIWVCDTLGVGITEAKNKEFEDKFGKDVNKFNECICAEVMRKMCFVNCPWWADKMYKSLSRIIPEGVKKKISIVNGTGLDDPEFVRFMGGKSNLQVILQSRVGLVGNAKPITPSGEITIGRRGAWDYTVDGKKGQTISWVFEVVGAATDFFVGVPDVGFSVKTYYSLSDDEVNKLAEEASESKAAGSSEDASGPPGMDEETVVPEKMVGAPQGKVGGTYEITKDGVISLQWSNMHSKVRSKTIKYKVKVHEPGTARADAVCSSSNSGSSSSSSGSDSD